MNENIDLTKILKGCPVGTEFYHAGYGTVVKFVDIALSSGYPILLALHNNPRYHYANLAVTEKGAINADYEGECLLFPSKDQRDWSKFKRFWDKSEVEEPKVGKFDVNTLQPFDKVLLRIDERGIWQPDFFGYKDGNCITCVTYGNVKCIPYNEETKYLAGKRDDCPEYYKWWEK